MFKDLLFLFPVNTFLERQFDFRLEQSIFVDFLLASACFVILASQLSSRFFSRWIVYSDNTCQHCELWQSSNINISAHFCHRSEHLSSHHLQCWLPFHRPVSCSNYPLPHFLNRIYLSVKYAPSSTRLHSLTSSEEAIPLACISESLPLFLSDRRVAHLFPVLFIATIFISPVTYHNSDMCRESFTNTVEAHWNNKPDQDGMAVLFLPDAYPIWLF
jgi:hypothetical protein